MRLKHPIFNQPLKAQLEFSERPTPPNYRTWPGGEELGETIQIWQVHEGEFPQIDVGLVSDPYGFEDTPDAEWISGGLNSKGPTAVALGRVGCFFHWGFFGDPSLMTDSAKDVFVNTVCWMKQFEGQRPIQKHKPSRGREWALVYTGYIRNMGDSEHPVTTFTAEGEIKRTAQEYLRTLFEPKVLLAAGQGEGKLDADKIEKYYRENMEFLIRGKTSYVVDEDVQSLGVSNRDPAILDLLAKRLEKDPQDPLATRCLERYFDSTFGPSEFCSWLQENRDRAYFTDTGGFKWRLVPDEYARNVSQEPERPSQDNPFAAHIEAAKLEAGQSFLLTVRGRTAPRWHIYPHDAKEALGRTHLTLELPDGFEEEGEWIYPEPSIDPVNGTKILHGEFIFQRRIRSLDEAEPGKHTIKCQFSFQCCDPFMCLPPEVRELAGEIHITPN